MPFPLPLWDPGEITPTNLPIFFWVQKITPHLELETLVIYYSHRNVSSLPGGEYCLQPLWKRGTLEERISPPSTTPDHRPTSDQTGRREAVCIEVLQKIAASVQCNEVEELQSRLIEERRNFKHGLVVFLGGKRQGKFFFWESLKNIWKHQRHLSVGAVSWNFLVLFLLH